VRSPRGDQSVLPAEIQRFPVGAEQDPGDLRVAGQPAGLRGGQVHPESGAGGTGIDVGSEQVGGVDGDHHLRR
jgi:hypothetical protein